jgi:hypothetical protein
MAEVGRYAFIGLCVGLIWGVGCSLVLLYSIYLAGYRKAVKDSLKPDKSARFLATVEKIQSQRSAKDSGFIPLG